MATHSSVLAWRIPGMGKPGGLPSMGSHRVGHNWRNLAAAAEIILLSDLSDKNKYFMVSLICGILKEDANELTKQKETHRHSYLFDNRHLDRSEVSLRFWFAFPW